MIVGVLSDSHGKVEITARAVHLLVDEGAEFLVHCGDVGNTGVLDALAGHRSMFVFGNNDWNRAPLAKYAQEIGVGCGDEEGRVAFGPKLGVITHGDDGRIVHRVLEDQRVDYLFLGHTHEAMDTMQGKVRVINPGALYRANQKTVAVLDTEGETVKFLIVE